MIFVSVGTWHLGFDRLIEALDHLADSRVIDEETIVQVGNSQYMPRNFKAIKFCTPVEFEKLVADSRVLITHAGVGAMMTGILNDRPVVVLPRKANLQEADDDHQFNTAEQFEKEGMVLVAYDTENLAKKIKEAGVFKPSLESEGLSAIQAEVRNYLQSLERTAT